MFSNNNFIDITIVYLLTKKQIWIYEQKHTRYQDLYI